MIAERKGWDEALDDRLRAILHAHSSLGEKVEIFYACAKEAPFINPNL